MTTKGTAIKAVRWTSIAKITFAMSTILKMSILARFLAKEDFGLMALVTFVLGFLNLFMDMGLSSAILHKQNITQQQYSSLYWINFIFSIFLFVLLFGISPFIAKWYKEPELVVLLPLMGTSLILAAVGKQFKTIEEKELNFKFVAIVEISGSLISLIIAVILAVMDYGVYSLVYAALAKFALVNALFFFVGIRKNGILFYFNYREIDQFVTIGLYRVGGQVVGYFNRDVDILMIGQLFGTDVLGGYSLAKQLVFRPQSIITPVLTRVASPMLAKFQNQIAELRKNYLYLLKLVSSINIPIYILIAIFAPFVVRVLYGPGYDDIVTLVRILSIFMVVRCVGVPIGSLVIATGRTDLDFKWSLFNLVVSPAAILIGSNYGIEGVAIALTISVILLYVPNWWFLSRKIIQVDLLTYTKAVIPDLKLLFNELFLFVSKRSKRKTNIQVK